MFCLDTQLHCCMYVHMHTFPCGLVVLVIATFTAMTLSALSYLSIVTIGSSHVVTVVVECNCITNKMFVYVYVLCKLKVKCTLTHPMLSIQDIGLLSHTLHFRKCRVN